MCPRCGEEMMDSCEACGKKICAMCGCPSCDDVIPPDGESGDEEL